MEYEDKEGNRVAVADLIHPIAIIKYLDADDVGTQVDLEVMSTHGNRRFRANLVDLMSAQESILKVFATNEYLINFKFANMMREYLNHELQKVQLSSSYQFYHSTMGFLDQDGRPPIFLLGETIVNGVISKYIDEKMVFTQGIKENYVAFLNTEVLPYLPTRFALVLGLTSVAASYLKEYVNVGTIIINACGPSSTGKTTALQFMASLWATPKVGNNALVKTFNATQMALMESIKGYSGVPIFLDDATSGGYTNRTSMIYGLAQSEPRLRSNSDGTLQDQGKSWSGCAMISSETTILSDSETRQGLIARVIDTNDLVWTQSAKHSERINRAINKDFGFIGREYVKEFLKIDLETIQIMFDECKEEVLEKLIKRDGLSERIANKIAMIRLTAKLVKQIFLWEEIDADEITKILIDSDQEQIEERAIGERAYELMKLFIQSEHQHFTKIVKQNIEQVEAKGELYGTLKYSRSKVLATIPSEKVKAFLFKNKIYEYKSVLAYWGDNKLIEKQKDRHTIKDSRLKVRCIKFPFEFDPETMLPWFSKNILISKYLEEKEAYVEIESIQEVYDDEANVNAIFEQGDISNED